MAERRHPDADDSAGDASDEQIQKARPRPPAPPRGPGAEGEIQPGAPRRSPPRPPTDDDDADDDDADERPRRRPPPRRRDDGISTIIPYHNGLALAAYYCGVFSIVPGIALILGPVAIGLGIGGMRRVSRNPEIKGTGHAITGIVLGSLTSLINWGFAAFILAAALSARR
jgi:hypothetical protein